MRLVKVKPMLPSMRLEKCLPLESTCTPLGGLLTSGTIGAFDFVFQEIAFEGSIIFSEVSEECPLQGRAFHVACPLAWAQSTLERV